MKWMRGREPTGRDRYIYASADVGVSGMLSAAATPSRVHSQKKKSKYWAKEAVKCQRSMTS